MIETKLAVKSLILFFAVFQLVSTRNTTKTSLKFSSTGYILMQPDMSPLQEALTICSWVKRQSNHLDDSQYWLSYVTTANEDEIVISDAARFWMFGDETSYSPPTLTTNEWHQICVTWGYSTKTKYVYYDGEEIGTEETGESKISIPGSLMLGQVHYGYSGRNSTHFNVELYNTTIWSTQLAGSQVKEVFTQGSQCSNNSLSFEDQIFISWEDVLLLDRQGEVTEIVLEECATFHHRPKERRGN